MRAWSGVRASGGASRRRQRGQSIVEFSMVVPIIATMLCAVLEFGMAFDAGMAIESASREGARVGASIGNTGTFGSCPNATAEGIADPTIINSVQRSLQKANVDLSTVTVTIFLADANGDVTKVGGVEKKDVWKWDGSDPLTAHFYEDSAGWPACGRHDGTFGGGIYDLLGVSITYTYTSRTGLLAVFSSGLPITARAVMPIGPPA